MDITPTNIYSSNRSRSRSRSRTRNSTANSRSTSSTRRPSFGSRRSLSSSSINKLTVTPTAIDSEKTIPTAQATLDNTLPIDFFKQELVALIKALRISKWHKRQLTVSNLIVSRISGALTNSIYKIEYKDLRQNISLPTLLLRVYGKNVDSIIDRESELGVLIKLSQKRIGPRLLGIFTNGRFEQFLEGFVTLTKENIRDEVISQMLGRRMKDLHYKIELDAKDVEADLPMSWRLIYKWLNMFEKDYLPTYAKNGIKEEDVFLVKFGEFKELIQNYKEWLFSKYDASSFSSNFKFCHNDTQYGNLLLHEAFNPSEIIVNTATKNDAPVVKSTSSKKDNYLVVIDFEYSGSNLPAYDLVNHFSEWMADYHDPEKSYYIHENKYPNQLEKLNLIKSYVEYDFQYPMTNIKTSTTCDIDQTNAAELIQFEIKKLYNECIIWRTTVQIYWCLWGLIQNGPIKTSNISICDSLASEQGIDSTYTITTELDNLQVEEKVAVEDEITSSDDDFDYLKYSQQKAALIMGDLISFNLLDKSKIDDSYLPLIKYLDCDFFDI